MGIAADSLTYYLVEWYRAGLDEGLLDDIAAVLDRSSMSTGDQRPAVRCVMTLAIPTDDVVFGVFAARSAAAVADVCQHAGMPPSRLSPALADHIHDQQRQAGA